MRSLFAALIVSLAAWSVFAENLESVETTNCLNMARVSKTDVVDGKTIKFYQGRKVVYENRLPRKCPGLSVYQAFSYKTHSRRLCKHDFIRVLDGHRMGAVCSLGEFYSVTDAVQAQ